MQWGWLCCQISLSVNLISSNYFGRDCEGLGVQRTVVKEEVSLPPGVSDGQKLKIKGMGHASDVF